MECYSMKKCIPVKKTKKWNEDVKRTFFSHGPTNSCGFAIGNLGAKSFIIEERRTDKNGCHLLFDAAIAEQNFVLVNL